MTSNEWYLVLYCIGFDSIVYFVMPLFSEILAKPEILSKETFVFAPEGTTFDFPKCDVRANPPAKITWKRIFWPMPVGRFAVQGNSL